jgi:hypothetical protein
MALSLTGTTLRSKITKEYHAVLDRAVELGFTGDWLNTSRTAVVLYSPDGAGQVRMPTGKGFQTDRPEMLIRRLERMVGDAERNRREDEQAQEAAASLYPCSVCGAEFESEYKRDAHEEQHAQFEAEQEAQATVDTADAQAVDEPVDEVVPTVGTWSEAEALFIRRWQALVADNRAGAAVVLADQYEASTDWVRAEGRRLRERGADLPPFKRGPGPARTAKPRYVAPTRPTSELSAAIGQLVERHVRDLESKVTELTEQLESVSAEASKWKDRWQALRSLISEEDDEE